MFKSLFALSALALSIGMSAAEAAQVKVTVSNNADPGGTYLTPVWIGFHDGSFDSFDAGSAASPGIEALAEVGDSSVLSGEFAGSGVDGNVGGAPIGPGTSASGIFALSADGSNDYLSFAAMVLPSSDYFIGNDNPLSASIEGILDGSFSQVSFTIAKVYDAGTEINDFTTSAPPIPAASGLFPGLGLPDSNPGAGADENGVVHLVPGTDYALFLHSDGVHVGDLNFDNYESLATITVSSVPLPAALPMLLAGLGGLAVVGRRKRSRA